MISWVVVFALGLLTSLAILGLRWQVLDSFSRTLKVLIVAVIFLKVFVSLTMGHLDIYRFIYFIKHFVTYPNLNPWGFSDPLADFPYPPFLLYLNSLLFFVKKLFFQNWPSIPDVWDFMLIRIPFLIADILFSRFLIKRSMRGYFLFLFSPVMLFHQVYSGQLDLIAAVPFVFSVVALADGKLLLGFIWLTISMVLKPYAILFLPFLLFFSTSIREFLKIGFLSGLAILLFKISEHPFALSPEYLGKMGAGAKFLFIPKYLSFYFLTWASLAVCLWQRPSLFNRRDLVFLGLFVVSFAVALVDYHSAGWLLWPVLLLTVWTERDEWLNWPWLWWTWSVLFILRWSFIDHSPFFDSLDVFLKHYLNLETRLGIGFFYRSLQANYSKEAADLVLGYSVQIFEIFTYFLLAQIGYTFFVKNRKVS